MVMDSVKKRKLVMMDDIDWSSLPPELLGIIVKCLTVNADYLRFQAVCKNWRSATPSPPTHLPCQIPWLMLPSCTEDTPFNDLDGYLGDFFSLSDNNKIHHIDFPESYTSGKRCFGSSLGWLSFVDYRTLSVTLFNPLTKAQIQLPSIGDEGMSKLDLNKLFLSDNPTSSNNYVVVTTFLNRILFFCRAGDDKWWSVEDHFNVEEYVEYRIDDGVFHKHQFYAIDYSGVLIVSNLDPYDLKEKTIASSVHYFKELYKRYLVEVSGELMMVNRRRCTIGDQDLPKTRGLCVYRFIPTSEKWIRVTNLGDYTLFLGMNSSFSLSAKDILPRGCKPNCIYFSDHDDDVDFVESDGHDSGIFNLEGGSIEPLPCYRVEREWIWPPPIWITPSLS